MAMGGASVSAVIRSLAVTGFRLGRKPRLWGAANGSRPRCRESRGRLDIKEIRELWAGEVGHTGKSGRIRFSRIHSKIRRSLGDFFIRSVDGLLGQGVQDSHQRRLGRDLLYFGSHVKPSRSTVRRMRLRVES